jgi:hypothetical protein
MPTETPALPKKGKTFSARDPEDDADEILRVPIINVTPGIIAGIKEPGIQTKKHSTIELQGSLSFAGNVLRQKSVGLACTSCTITVNAGKLEFTENQCHTSS